jgi:hypothetical protein
MLLVRFLIGKEDIGQTKATFLIEAFLGFLLLYGKGFLKEK